MKPTLIEDRWPIVVVRWPKDLTLHEVDGHFEDIKELAARGQRFVLVIDMLESGAPSATHRAHAAKRLAEIYPAVGHNVAGAAHVIGSALVRGILTAVYWLAPPPFETTIVATRQQAIEWAERKLAAESARREAKR
ncbi:MAG: hypothetical protein K8H88_26955 [Sandaracinaceae bacterium]|nr:hypothetical protein [Sandaracinaceae bacterium]